MAKHALCVVVKELKLALIVACIVKGKSNYGVSLLFKSAFKGQGMTSYSTCVWDFTNLMLFV